MGKWMVMVFDADGHMLAHTGTAFETEDDALRHVAARLRAARLDDDRSGIVFRVAGPFGDDADLAPRKRG